MTNMGTILEERRVRLEREALGRCRTDAQRSRVEAIYAGDVGAECWPETIGGGSIVRACRTYLASGDAEKITAGLYAFATSLLGEIAHFGLGGFRSVYADAADFATRLGHNSRSVHVYMDGMTGDEVRAALQALAAELGALVRERSRETRRAEALAEAQRLAAEHGFAVTA